jgi:hypothetical protein
MRKWRKLQEEQYWRKFYPMFLESSNSLEANLYEVTRSYTEEVRSVGVPKARQPLTAAQAEEVDTLLGTKDAADWDDAIGDALTRVDQWVYPGAREFSLELALRRVGPVAEKRITDSLNRVPLPRRTSMATGPAKPVGPLLYSGLPPKVILRLCAMTAGRAAMMVLHRLSESTGSVPVHISNSLAETFEKSVDAMIELTSH